MNLDVCLKAFMRSVMGSPLTSFGRFFRFERTYENCTDHQFKIRIEETYNQQNRPYNQYWSCWFGRNDQYTCDGSDEPQLRAKPLPVKENHSNTRIIRIFYQISTQFHQHRRFVRLPFRGFLQGLHFPFQQPWLFPHAGFSYLLDVLNNGHRMSPYFRV